MTTHAKLPGRELRLWRAPRGRRARREERAVSRRTARLGPEGRGELGALIDAEGRAEHRCLEVVGDEGGRRAAELVEGLDVEADPGVDALVEGEPADHPPALSQHEDEDPDLYRMLAAELGLRPGPRAQIVADIKRALVSLVDERGVVPIVILDDAQGLRDDSLDLDGRDYLTLWLVGHPHLARRLRLQQHAALAQRVIVYAPLVAKTDPELIGAMLDHGFAAAGAPPDLMTDDARAMLVGADQEATNSADEICRRAPLARKSHQHQEFRPHFLG